MQKSENSFWKGDRLGCLSEVPNSNAILLLEGEEATILAKTASVHCAVTNHCPTIVQKCDCCIRFRVSTHFILHTGKTEGNHWQPSTKKTHEPTTPTQRYTYSHIHICTHTHAHAHTQIGHDPWPWRVPPQEPPWPRQTGGSTLAPSPAG